MPLSERNVMEKVEWEAARWRTRLKTGTGKALSAFGHRVGGQVEDDDGLARQCDYWHRGTSLDVTTYNILEAEDVEIARVG